MIHKIIVIDQRTTVGQVLFDNKVIALETDLLTGFISALSAFAKCLGEDSIEFKGADLGHHRFSLITRDYLTYAVFQDLYDNEPFARLTLKEVIDTYHDELLLLNLSLESIRPTIIKEITNLIELEYFPITILKEINAQIESLIVTCGLNFDLLFLSSITNGIIHVWRRPINPIIMKQFLDIISKIPLEMNWIAEGKASNFGYFGLNDDDEPDLEAWIIKRISTTNFFIAGRVITKTNENQENFSTYLSEIFEQITNKIEKALEHEWIQMAEKI